MSFQNSSNISIINIKAGHTESGYFSQSENVVIKNTIFTDNVADKLIEQEDIAFDASNTFKNNSFDSIH